MKKAILLAACALAATFATLNGQEAKIMIVERSDSQKLAKSYREYKEALSRWEAVKAEVAKQYTSENGKTIAGWEKIQFSADFRAIVPETSQYSGYGYRNCFSGITTNTFATPATGITGTSGSANLVLDGGGSWRELFYDSAGVDSSLTTKEKR